VRARNPGRVPAATAGRREKRTVAKAPPEGSRYIPAAVRDEVWRRDGGQCTFVGVTGHRCSSRYRIQFHHVVPAARRGPSTVENVVLMCQRHNLMDAIWAAIREGRQKKVVSRALPGE
jgi:5-methylcytosine-specific restriction endonuclease McrA